jgi:hypothetical protein
VASGGQGCQVISPEVDEFLLAELFGPDAAVQEPAYGNRDSPSLGVGRS